VYSGAVATRAGLRLLRKTWRFSRSPAPSSRSPAPSLSDGDGRADGGHRRRRRTSRRRSPTSARRARRTPSLGASVGAAEAGAAACVRCDAALVRTFRAAFVAGRWGGTTALASSTPRPVGTHRPRAPPLRFAADTRPPPPPRRGHRLAPRPTPPAPRAPTPTRRRREGAWAPTISSSTPWRRVNSTRTPSRRRRVPSAPLLVATAGLEVPWREGAP